MKIFLKTHWGKKFDVTRCKNVQLFVTGNTHFIQSTTLIRIIEWNMKCYELNFTRGVLMTPLISSESNQGTVNRCCCNRERNLACAEVERSCGWTLDMLWTDWKDCIPWLVSSSHLTVSWDNNEMTLSIPVMIKWIKSSFIAEMTSSLVNYISYDCNVHLFFPGAWSSRSHVDIANAELVTKDRAL